MKTSGTTYLMLRLALLISPLAAKGGVRVAFFRSTSARTSRGRVRRDPMNRVRFLMYGIAAGVLALAGFLYAIGPMSVAARLKSAIVGDGSTWPTVLLSAVVLVTGIAAQHHLVDRPDKPPAVQGRSLNTRSLMAIVAMCGLGLLASLCAVIYGWDIDPGLPWDR